MTSAPPPEAIVEFGPGTGAPRPRRWNPTGLGSALLHDRRLVPAAAAAAAIALFASIFSEWQVTAVDPSVFGGSEAGLQPVRTDVGDLGGWGGGYLGGVFVLVLSVVLTLFGPPNGRVYARLAGWSAGGLLLAVLVAIEPTLGDTSRVMGGVLHLQLEDDQYELIIGRGVWCAFAGVLLAMATLYLAGKHDPKPTYAPAAHATAPQHASEAATATNGTTAANDATAPAGTNGSGGGTPGSGWATAYDAQPVFSWRRPRGTDEEEGLPDQPMDLSVTAVTPFTARTDDRPGN